MSNIINCPKCQRQLQVPDSLLGQQVQCPSCSARFLAAINAPDQAASSDTTPPDSPSSAPPPAPTDDYGRLEYDAERSEYDDRYERRPRHFRQRRDVKPHMGVMALVLGIIGIVVGVISPLSAFLCPFISIVFCALGLIPSIISWLVGQGNLREIRAGTMDPDGQGLCTGGWICGIIGTALNGIGLVCCIIGMIVGVAFFAAGAAGGIK